MMGAGGMVEEELYDKARARISELEARVTQLQSEMSALVITHQTKQRYGSRANRQRTVFNWALRMFGERTRVVHERALRVLEEATELAQAAGVNEDTARRMIDRVFFKPKGDVRDELGGVMVTTLAMAEAMNLDADDLERNEIERVMAKPEADVRASQSSKCQMGLGEPL